MGVNQLITRERIQKAKLLLLAREKSVAQFSLALGFTSAHYFSWKFKQVTGISPSVYTQQKER